MFRSWLNIGFTPFTRQALGNKKINGGASEEMRVFMEDTQKKYKGLKKMVGRHSFKQICV